jgi:phosphoglycerol transferase
MIFGHADFFSFMFNLTFGLGGTPWPMYYLHLAASAALVAAPLVAIWRLRGWVLAVPFGSAALALAILAANPILHDLVLLRSGPAQSEHESLMRDYSPVVPAFASDPPNLLFLFLEGFDRSYTDPELFGDLAAPLRDLEAQGLAFTNVGQVEATGWSAAGHAAAWCGLPLLPNIHGFNASTEILPQETCLPNVLASKGYVQTYLSGAHVTSESYYGFDNFLRRRDINRIRDSAALQERFWSGRRDLGAAYWGLFDSELLEVVAEEVDLLAAGGVPFAVYASTMDTHGPLAGISPACTGGEGRLSEDMAPAVACVARIVADLVADLRARHGENLIVVVMSDHLAHRNNLTGRLKTATRCNFVTIVGTDRDGERMVRPASMLDMFPTILDAMGLLDSASPAAGLGRSLLRAEPTLVEADGISGVNTRLRRDAALMEHLWHR